MTKTAASDELFGPFSAAVFVTSLLCTEMDIQARELLLSTTLPIAEVGKAVGLADPYHFSKLFRRHVGLSPREFRKEHGPFSTPPQPSRHRRRPPSAS